MLNQKPKRRRLNDGASASASALSRPFKSPLRKEVQEERKEHTTSSTTSNVSSIKDEEGASVSTNSQIPSRHSLKSGFSSSKQSNNSSPFQKKPSTATELRTSSDPEIAALRRKRIALQSQLTSLRSELDTAQQALRIESSSRDDELKKLIVKWRGVSQKAADELFESAKDKIERMGGVGAWKERESEQLQRSQMWEDEDFYEGSDERGANGTNPVTPCARKDERKEEAGDEEVSVKQAEIVRCVYLQPTD